jgi:hypothetical protein
LEPLSFVVHPFNSHWINTMYRCLLAAAAALSFALPAAAQVQRNFPQNALRGTITFGAPPQILLNNKPARLAPGARIRGLNNMLEMSGSLVNLKATVNYTFENAGGLVKDVWVLRPEEIARKPWPETLAEAQAWTFDPAAQVWIKP